MPGLIHTCFLSRYCENLIQKILHHSPGSSVPTATRRGLIRRPEAVEGEEISQYILAGGGGGGAGHTWLLPILQASGNFGIFIHVETSEGGHIIRHVEIRGADALFFKHGETSDEDRILCVQP